MLDFGGILAYASGADGLTPFPDEADDDGGFSEVRYFAAGRLQVVGRRALPVAVSGDAAFAPVGRMPVDLSPRPVPQGEFWDESADYFGAVRPGTSRSWLSGWTAFPGN